MTEKEESAPVSHEDTLESSEEETTQTMIQENLGKEMEDQQEPIKESQSLKTAFAGVAGNILEWYDFAAFGFFSDIISENFFAKPQDEKEENDALVYTFLVFGSAFLARPIGGALIGSLGDTHGRKGALETSVYLMAFPTFLLGCLPTYSMIGSGSTFLLMVMRLLQGLSVGGQLMSSVVFTLERTHISRWGFWGSSVYAAASIGVTAGSMFSAILRAKLSDEDLKSWGWRIPFWFGALGVIPATYLKYYAEEHPISESTSPSNTKEDMSSSSAGQNSGEEEQTNEVEQKRNPLKESFGKKNLRALIASALLPAVSASAYYITFIWMATYMETIIEPPVPHAMVINTVLGVFGGIFLTLLGGWVADVVGDYTKLMLISALLLGILFPFLMGAIGMGFNDSDPSITFVAFLIQMTLALLLSLWNGAMLPWMILKFPAELRLTSASLGYNISLAFWGGFSPAMATALASTNYRPAPGFIVTAGAFTSLLAMFIAPREFESIGTKTADQNYDAAQNENQSEDESKPIWVIDDQEQTQTKVIEMI